MTSFQESAPVPDTESPADFWETIGYLIGNWLDKIYKAVPSDHLVIFIPKVYERPDFTYYYDIPIKYIDISTPYIGLRVS